MSYGVGRRRQQRRALLRLEVLARPPLRARVAAQAVLARAHQCRPAMRACVERLRGARRRSSRRGRSGTARSTRALSVGVAHARRVDVEAARLRVLEERRR